MMTGLDRLDNTGRSDVTHALAQTKSYVISTAGDLAAVEQDWDTLTQSGRYTPFQTRSWLMPWYAIAGPHFGAKPLFVTVRDRSTGAPVMMLTLCVRRLGALKIIEFADGSLSDYNAPILAKDFAPNEREMRTLWRDILSALPAADIVRLEKLPTNVGGASNPVRFLQGIRPMTIDSWRIDLPATRAAYDTELLTSTFRKELRRKGRRVESRGKATLVHARDVDDALRIFRALADMRAKRFEELGRENVLSVPALKAFYEAVIVQGWQQGFTMLSSLEVGGEIVAALFALKQADTYYLLFSAFQNGEWKSSSPGNVALDRMATHLIETGVGVFDFTIGNESYKRDFGARPQSLATVDYSRSVLGWPVVLRRTLSARVGNGLRSPAVSRAAATARSILRIGS